MTLEDELSRQMQ